MNGMSASYSCTALLNSNKKGDIRPIDDGYYDLVLGALNFYNSSNEFYAFDRAKELFKESSELMRRISTGNLKGENGHPKRVPGMTFQQYLIRILNIEETNVSHHIRRVYIDDQNVKDKNGNTIIAVRGEVKPAGVAGPALKEALENRHENVCFSIRSLTHDIQDANGRVTKHITKIVTWDWVTEPGIYVATKYNNPALEALVSEKLNMDILMDARKEILAMGMGFENAKHAIDDAIRSFGWNPVTGKKAPPAASW